MQTFRIIQPTPALKPFIRYYWILQDSTSGIVSQRTLPTGCISLVFHRGERLKVTNRNELQPHSFICGQESGYSDVTSTGDIEMIVVVFQPHAAKIFFRMPVTLLRDRNVAVADIENTALRDLAHKVEDSENHDTCIELIENYFYKCLMHGTTYHLPRLAEVVRYINNSTQTNIKTLANIACLSEKQFCRVFSEHIGTTPKDFLRVVRMQRTLSVLQRNPRIGFAQLSYECGYTDQSHMIKEFKLFSGYTPKEYIARYSPVSDYFTF
ncbi:helix-turn-helix domain-containing protein [Bacteroides caecimuris]|uniref:AraC family transcriptional regulator n=2 Tax=Bacteroides caecimuris TaxID=1796613 RepID=UPI00272CF59A|nr:helix-turn-helix domain-containing protein [Bacteroides caecimuris]